MNNLKKFSEIKTEPQDSGISKATTSYGTSSISRVQKNTSNPTIVLYDDLTRETTNPGSFGHETKRFKGTEIILVEDDDENDVIYDGNFEFKNEGSDLCCICLDNNVNSVLVPCGHLTLCYGCAELHSKEKQNRCPICRSKVVFFIKTYKS